MKNIIILLVLSIVLVSCGKDNDTIEKVSSDIINAYNNKNFALLWQRLDDESKNNVKKEFLNKGATLDTYIKEKIDSSTNEIDTPEKYLYYLMRVKFGRGKMQFDKINENNSKILLETHINEKNIIFNLVKKDNLWYFQIK